MTTQFIAKLNKTETGFHLLMSLCIVDGSVNHAESEVILEFLEKNFKGSIDIIKEQAFLLALPAEELKYHFIEVVEQFYKLSSVEERNNITSFAMKVAMADTQMQSSENSLINALYDAWGIE